MRGAKWTESANWEPPKPRLIVAMPGNDFDKSQRRMLELPTKRTASLGGGLSLSLRSKAAISFSQREKSAGFVSAARACRLRKPPSATSSKARRKAYVDGC